MHKELIPITEQPIYPNICAIKKKALLKKPKLQIRSKEFRMDLEKSAKYGMNFENLTKEEQFF